MKDMPTAFLLMGVPECPDREEKNVSQVSTTTFMPLIG